jgi:hypothetical protein
MTGELVRDLGYIEWTDPDAWMEKMSGARWDALVEKENAAAKKLLKVDPAIFASVKSYRDFSNPVYYLGPIKIEHLTGFTYKASWANKTVECNDIDYKKNIVIYSHDIGNGAEHYRLQAANWHKDGISGQVAIVDNRVYFLRVQKKLWFNRLCSCKLDGTDEQMHYKELDGHYNLRLFKGPGRQLFLIRENSGTIEGTSIKKIVFNPIENDWQLVFPSRAVESANPREGFYITRVHGERTLWKNNREVLKIVGHIWFDLYQLWDGVDATIFYSAPNLAFQIFKTGKIQKFPYHSALKYLNAKSLDKTNVKYILISRVKKPVGLLACGYGAYGIPTNLGDANPRWGAILDAGWAVAFALIRGGGDHDAAWFKAAQRAGRHRSFEDFEAVIAAAQKESGVGPEKTVIYGRSAGGFLVGALLNRNSDGRLFKAVYAEVPYVDVLRTTTNPELPLTMMEYDEFGNPRERLEDFIFLLNNSPCNNIVNHPGGKIAVLCRTAENDSEVYAYESMKWILRLRELTGGPKILVIKKGEGHFAPEDSIVQDISEDFTFFLEHLK